MLTTTDIEVLWGDCFDPSSNNLIKQDNRLTQALG